MKKLKNLLLAAVALTICTTANAQKWGATPEDSVECVKNVSLYQSFFKEKQYLDAYDSWKECLHYCPAQHKNLYIKGVTIMKAKIAAAKSAEERNALIDELMNLYDLRIKNFGEEAKVKALKAYDMSQLRKGATKEVYELYADAVAVGGGELDENYVVLFFNTTIDYVKAGFAEPTLVVDNYDIASDLLDNLKKKSESDSAKVAKINGYIGNLESAFSPYASCDQLVAIYEKKFEADPNNLDLLRKITNIMMKKGCTSEELFFKATENLNALDPSPANSLRMGQMCVSKELYSKAVEYLSDAVKGLEEDKDKYKAYILLGMSHSAQNSLGAARSAFYKAAEVDGTKGEPYIQIAQLYAKSARLVDDGLNGRSVYWAAVDKLRRAKSVDSSSETTDLADKLIGTYSNYFPKKTDAFMLNLTDGNGYTVGGWIGESTTVRTRN